MVHTAQLAMRLTDIEYEHIYRTMYNIGAGTPWNRNRSYLLSDHGNGINKLIITKDGERRSYANMEINLAKLAGASGGELYHGTTEEVQNLFGNLQNLLWVYTGNDIISDIGNWNVKRMDYAVDIKTEHVPEYISVFRRGYMPPKMVPKADVEEYSEYTSVALKNKSVQLNIYDKYKERLHNAPLEAERWRNVLRFEMQLLLNGVNNIIKKVEAHDRTLATMVLDSEVLAETARKMEKYYWQTVGMGDHYTAREAMRLKGIRTEKKYVSAITAVESCGSVYNAAQKDKNVLRLWRKLGSERGVNLATIPKGATTEYLPNLHEKLRRELIIYRTM